MTHADDVSLLTRVFVLYKCCFFHEFLSYAVYYNKHTHLVTHLVWPHQQDNQPERPGLADQSMKKPILVFLLHPIHFNGVETGSPNYLLVQHIPPINHSIIKKNTSDSPECTSFYLILACDLLSPCYSYPV